jgi:tight adherence protein C
MLTITIVGLFCFLVVVIALFGYAYYARSSRLFRRLAPGVVDASAGGGSEARLSPVINAFGEIGEKIPISFEIAVSSRHDLSMAGFRSKRAVAVYYGIRIVAAAAAAGVAFVFASQSTVFAPWQVVLIIAAGLAGYLIPGLVMEHLIVARQEKLRFSLPDILDLLVVCVEAGLGLDQALLTVSRELKTTHPVLCSELSLVNLELRAGLRRADALHNLAERTGEKEIRKLVTMLVQTDRFGTSIADALRSHAVFMRRRRRLEAEERAGKVGVKLVFPIFFFLLPAMLVIAGGPGVLMVFRALLPMLRSF